MGVEFVVQVWEQEFAWTQADKAIKLAAKALTVVEPQALAKQPIFCFETMMHMLYWSCLVYDYKRVRPDSGVGAAIHLCLLMLMSLPMTTHCMS